MVNQSEFFDLVVKHFEFLTSEYKFSLRVTDPIKPLGMVHYEKLPLTIDIGWYKGEIYRMVFSFVHLTIIL